MVDKLVSFLRNYRAQRARFLSDITAIKSVLIDAYVQNDLQRNPRYQNPKRLIKHEFQVYSQNGEDGMINEIFNRIGVTNRIFVEIGVQDGLETNSTFLLLNGWQGYWIEGNPTSVNAIQHKFSQLIERQMLITKQAFVTAENIEAILCEIGVPSEFDMLSIDIDGNDYWVWKAIERYNPRMVVIEYNSLFPPDVKWVMKYNPDNVWDGTSYFNSSLKSLESLGESKGYCLVGCNFHGINAFFVRKDLIHKEFCEPYTAENHYEPIRYHLQKKNGFRRGFGDFEQF